MCTDDSPASLAAAVVRHDVEPTIEIDLEPVDSVVVTTLMDNVTDSMMADHEPARRADPARGPRRQVPTMAEGDSPDVLIAEHGFSVLVTVTKAGNDHRFEPLIPRVLDDLAALSPGVLVPAHCTGWRAQHAMSARFPAAFVPNSVGTSFYL